ncbi:TlpA disulfide reductase family protein [Elusimicrobiota bacterium]
MVGDKVPVDNLDSFYNESVSSSSTVKKVIFLNFWGSWCPPCKAEFPELDALGHEYMDKDLVILAFSIDRNRKSADRFIDSYLKKMGKDKPGINTEEMGLAENMKILFDEESKIVSAFRVMGVPTSYIIDTEGVIRFIHSGFSGDDPAKWREEIDSLLPDEKPAAADPAGR